MSGSFRILIIEDSPSDAELTVAVLRQRWPQLEYTLVDSAAQFRSALADAPDTIVADYEVPGFGAVPALNILKELNSEIPLIVLTGAVTEEIVVQCMRMGAADYLLKDRMTRLPSAVANALGMRKEREEKRRAQRQRELSEQQYRSLFFHHPDAVYALDLAGCFVSMNRACEQLLGYAQEELRGKAFVALLPAQEREPISQAFEALSAGQPRHFRTHYLRNDNSRVELSVTAVPIEVEERIVGIYGIAKDVTEEMHARLALEASERQQRQLAELNSAILNSLPAHIALLDHAGNVVAVNEAWRTDGTQGSFDDPQCRAGVNYIEVCRKAEGECIQELPLVVGGLTQVLSGQRDNFVIEYPARGGAHKRWFRMMVTPVTRGAGAHAAVVMHLEVTDRRLAEEQLRINANALRHLTESVVVTDHELRVVTVNKAFTMTTGYEAHEILGQSIDAFLAHEYPDSLLEDIRAQVGRAGGWKGELRSRRRDGEAFPAFFSFSAIRDDSGKAQHYTAVFTDLSRFREFEQRIEYLAMHDALTGLPNRAALVNHLSSALVYAESQGLIGAVLLIELDRFMTVNDTLGHPIGDMLLKAVAHRIDQLKQPEDILARMGGDEFMLFSIGAGDTEDMDGLAQRVRTALQLPFHLGDHELFITASIGISCFPADGRDAESLMRAADAAVYMAKQQGRNTVAAYSSGMNAAAMERFILQNSLPQALARNEFLLEYQPTVDLRTGQIHGAEALIRWQHPQLGLISPTHFIGLAEDTGHIIQIGEWVLHEACMQLQRWRAEGWREAVIAVNLSARQFAQPDLARQIERILVSTGTPPQQLSLEITESMMMRDPAAAERLITRLTRQGIGVAIDDFGTGYSSLNYLRRFRVNSLKVDKSFVSGVPGDRGSESIVRAIIALGKALGMTVIGEGAETAEQVHFLKSAGCDLAQGFYYSRPVPAQQVLQLEHSTPLALAAVK